MLLSFSSPPFIPRIEQNIKPHTVRDDKHNRWKPGMKIHFWFGNPRNTRAKVKPYHFGNGIVEKTNRIIIDTRMDSIYIYGEHFIFSLRSEHDLTQFAINDGFDNYEQFKLWFPEPFDGKLIWWDYSQCTFFNNNNKNTSHDSDSRIMQTPIARKKPFYYELLSTTWDH